MNKLKLFLVFTGFAFVLNAQKTNLNLIPEPYRNHPEYGKLTINNDPSSVELIQHRTENSRTFVDGKGQYHTTQSGGYMHFKNSKNEWISIQETVSQKASKLGIFQSEMPMTVDYTNGKTEMALEKNGRSVIFGSNVSMRSIDENGKIIKSSSSNQQMTNYNADEHDITLKNIFPQIDRVQTMEYWSLRTDYKINSKLDLPAAARYVEFADEMQLPAGWRLEYAEGELTAEGWQGTLHIVNAEGFVVSTISKPLYYDAFEGKNRDDLNGHYGMGFYRIEKTAYGTTLKLLVPTEWLNSETLVYPLTIDPTATNTYANLQAVQDKNTMFNANCQATMTVSIPAGAYQVTGTTTSWRMWAKGFIYTNNYADKTEQRSRVGAHLTGTSWTATQSGSGTNHSGSGYTYTSANNGQTYTLNNQNIANGCYTASTISYIWQGYQTFFPHGSSAPAVGKVIGCVTNYQELVTNTWVVTTTYNVLTMSMTATPTTQTICSGQQTGIALTSSSSPTTYAWTVAQSGTSGASNGNGANIAQTLTATGTPGTATYTITPTFGTCVGTPTNVVITVNPAPTVSAGPDQSICPGQQVTLTGSGTAATYTWNNGVVDGQPFTPAAAGTYTVTGTLNGCTATDQMTVSMGSLTTLNAGTDQTVCAGQQVTLTATGASTYSWDNGVTNGVAFTPTVTTTYTVTAQSSGGCGSTDQVTVTVNPMPVVNAGTDQTICEGSSVTLTASGISNPVWDNGVTDGQSFSPASTATYTVTGAQNGCSGSDQVTITVTPLPAVSAGNDVTVCAGSSVTLSGSGASGYTWNNGVQDGVPFVPAATTTYQVTSANGACSSTDQVIVTVNPLPVVNAGADQTVCAGTSVTLTATGISNPLWDNGVTDGQPFVPAATATYTVTGSSNGCPGTDQVTVTVTALPGVSAGNDITVCEGANVTLSGSGATTFVWDNNIQNGVPFVPAGTATYQVTGTTSGCSGTDQVTVTVTPTPVVSFIPSVTSGCLPLTVTYTNNAAPNNNTCQWIFGDGATGNGCGSVTHTYTTAGCFDVTLTSTTPNGCVGQQQLNDIVCTAPDPIAEFTTNPSALTVLDAYSQMTNTSQGAASYLWNFGDGSATSTLVNPGHLFPSDLPGTYQIMLVAFSDYGCIDTAYVNIEVQDELIYYIPNSFTPDDDQHNPVFKPVFTSGFDPYDYTLLIFDRWGEIIFESHNALVGWDGTYGEGGGVLMDGTYTWRIDFKTTRTDERKLLLGTVTLIR